MPSGFKRTELKLRYDVSTFREDDWHAYAGQRTLQYITRWLREYNSSSVWLLNAGAGVYQFGPNTWREICFDLFNAPILSLTFPICGTVEELPFRSNTLGAIICVGEVLGYCDPVRALAEFGRVLVSSGLLICDFGNSRGVRNWFTESYGRAAALVTSDYNHSPEKTWIYDPAYMQNLLRSFGFDVRDTMSTHTWSAIARRIQLSTGTALFLENKLKRLRLPPFWGDVITIAALKF